jgi:hypothetical protein
LHEGGTMVVLRDVSGFFWWTRHGGKEDRVVGLAKKCGRHGAESGESLH